MNKYDIDLDLNAENSLSKIIKMIAPGTKILEFGPANGRLTKHLKEVMGCIVDIVEIDEMSGKEAAKYSSSALVGIDIGDIETYKWCEELKSNRYDYIIFADVLEHLYDPLNVLKKCKSMLKDSGSVLISIPNIAHNSILINLFYNRFQYTPTGLLDETHIRFFAYNNLGTFFDEAGFDIAKMDAVQMMSENTEQAQYFDQSFQVLDDILDKRELGDIYQFVIELKIKGRCTDPQYNYAASNSISAKLNLPYQTKFELKQELSNKEGHIELLLESERNLQFELKDKEDHIELLLESEKKLEQELKNKERHIELLLESVRELERIKVSRSWRYLSYIWKFRDATVPYGSKRRLALKLCVKFVKRPVKVIKKCTPTRIGKLFYYLKREGVSGVSRRLDECISGTIQFDPIITNEVMAGKTIEEYKRISFPIITQNPKVSIIIPVYNQFHYTYECLVSILKNTEDISYELIIADDCSDDLTKNIVEIVRNIRVIKTEENSRFLKNCNNAAKYCKGEYILFLNNDTQVQQGWLSSLVNLMDNDQTIGLAGSKLVYPDGMLQEAGGIIWNDASGWNYGRLSDPNAPEFNYVKEVDYISGAAIVIRKSLWEEIGGFDERFAPAYFEDSDLAFEVRRHGYKVVYQPKSAVVHFEGKTNGTDIGSGQKQYQVVNHSKFLDKWKHVLETEHFPNGNNVFLARDRSRGKKTILIVDHYVPQYDKDAGSRTVYQYIKLFLNQGFNVKFIGDNFCKQEPYTGELSIMGVEILYGEYYSRNWKQWVKENAEYIDYVLLNRPHISIKYIDYLKASTNAKIFYYGHDLHFLREMREFELTGDSTLLKSSKDWEKQEMKLISLADYAYYPSQIEVEEVLKRDAEVNIKAIPAYLFDDVEEVEGDFKERKEIIFVGGFGHRPNVDAVVWFAKEIMPKLSWHGLKVTIIGSNAPDEVLKLGTSNLIIRGFVSDEVLKYYYNNSRLVVVPLRYGAGIKGKVVEAMCHGVPIITTSVGAEGIKGIENIAAVKDDAKEFADAIISLYNDIETLKEMSTGYTSYIKRHFSNKAAIEAIGKDFGIE